MYNRFKKFLVMMVLIVFFAAIYSVPGAWASTTDQLEDSTIPAGDTTIGSNIVNIGEDEDEDEDEDEGEDEDGEGNMDDEGIEDEGEEEQDEQIAENKTDDQEEELNDQENQDEDLELELDEDQSQEVEKAAEKLLEIQEELAKATDKLTSNPTDTGAYEDLAKAYAALGQWDKVAEAANQLLALEPDNEEAGVLLAASKYRQGDDEGALQLLQDMAAREADDDDVYEMLGELLELRGEVDEALEEYEKAAALNPDDPNIFDRLSKTYQKLNKEGVKVFVNGKKTALDVQPQMREGRTLVPFRSLAESLGAQVLWDGTARQVTVAQAGSYIQLSIDSPQALVNGNPVTLDVPASIVDGRVLVPLRFISEGLNARVTWEPASQMVIVIQ